MRKVILYYKFVPLKDPEMARLWQLELCKNLELKGRIIVSPQGINGTLGGNIENLRAYKREMNRSGILRGIAYKWSEGEGQEFPKLRVMVRPELVSFNAPDEVEITERGVINGGKHIKPKALHELLKKKPNTVFFDGRNAYEAEVGRFKDAIVPNTETTRDFIKELESGKFDELKDKPVVTYCTGGVRCEILSALMLNRGFQEVYQIDGGIVKYGETFGDTGLWQGVLHIFDGRMRHRFSDKTKDIAKCAYCQLPTSRYINCDIKTCNKRVLVCDSCSAQVTCPEHAPLNVEKA